MENSAEISGQGGVIRLFAALASPLWQELLDLNNTIDTVYGGGMADKVLQDEWKTVNTKVTQIVGLVGKGECTVEEVNSELNTLLADLRSLSGTGFPPQERDAIWRMLVLAGQLQHCSTVLGNYHVNGLQISKVTENQGGGGVSKEFLLRYSAEKLLLLLLANGRLAFPQSESPLVSIILILYNKAELTYLTLESIMAYLNVPYEVIIVDNGSKDFTGQLLGSLDGATVIRNNRNEGFLQACNQAAAVARGKYVLFLNNDAQLSAGAITSGLEHFRDTAVGAVGGRLILPDGTLQEAGSIVWADGSCQGYGRGDFPFAPQYSFARKVDYCSGAFLMTPLELFRESGGFDERYAPAYYEEVDYCMVLRQKGYAVIYEPRCTILHYEFGSSAKIGDAIALQKRNLIKFREKWNSELAQWQFTQGKDSLLKARSPNDAIVRVLYIDERVPFPYLGSGFPRANLLLTSLVEAGAFVTLYPLDMPNDPLDMVYEVIPRSVEVMIGFGHIRLEAFLRERLAYYQIIIISRPHNMKKFNAIYERHRDWFTGVKIIYDAEAIFARRDILKAEVTGVALPKLKAEILLRDEIALTRNADIVFTVSDGEKALFDSHGIRKAVVLGHAIQPRPTEASFSQRSYILFVGGITDDGSPNADAIVHFANNIFPLLQKSIGAKLMIAGTNQSRLVASLESDDIRVLGTVSDLCPLFERAQLFIVPTRFAAGIPIKALDAASYGVPIVGTPLIGEQLGWVNEESILIGRDDGEFALQCQRLFEDEALWYRLRQNALAKVLDDASLATFRNTVSLLLNS